MRPADLTPAQDTFLRALLSEDILKDPERPDISDRDALRRSILGDSFDGQVTAGQARIVRRLVSTGWARALTEHRDVTSTLCMDFALTEKATDYLCGLAESVGR